MKVVNTYIVKPFGNKARCTLYECENDLWFIQSYDSLSYSYSGVEPIQTDEAQYLLDSYKTRTT